MVKVTSVKFEHHREPIGIGEDHPRISWNVVDDDDESPSTLAWLQTFYEVEISWFRGEDCEESAAHRIESSNSVLVPWPGFRLRSRERVNVRVRVWGNSSPDPSAWSEVVSLETGLLSRTDWSSKLITPAWDEDPQKTHPPALLRKRFSLAEPVVLARLYITAHGVYEAELNGQRVGDHVLAPGWTSYNHQLRYQTFDVTKLVRQGDNVIGAHLGEGWFRGRLGFEGGRRAIYGDRTALLAQLEVLREGGRRFVIGTDDSWKSTTGAIIASEIYDGETYDARLQKDGWSLAEYQIKDNEWHGVRELEFPKSQLVSPIGPPVRRTQVVNAIKILTTPKGRAVVDFGQNLVGRLRIRVNGPAGQVVTFLHTEVLDKDGEVATLPLRTAKATDVYTIRGTDGVEEWEPRFTFHGFRYAQVDGWPSENPLDLDSLEAIVLHTDMKRTGWFECSEPMLNKLHENVCWGMRGNFLDVPTDCPQRDERLGWTGDIQVFSPTASFLYDCCGMLESWLRDLAFEQSEDEGGVPPLVVPDTIGSSWGTRVGQAVWHDAAVGVPWVLYQRFGDLEILREQYASMTAWVDTGITKNKEGLWKKGFQLGDWLDPAAPPEDPAAGATDGMLVADASFIHSADLMVLISNLLGDENNTEKYRNMASKARASFQAEYITPNGRLTSDSQTAYVLALRYSLFANKKQIDHASTRLSEIVSQKKFRIATGFAGTPFVCEALTTTNHSQLAYRMLLETKCPSWLYPITMGATTIWERWDSLLPDGTINVAEMTSFNHYALGAVADWMHGTIGGVSPLEPGWKKIKIVPVPGGTVTFAKVRHETPYGMLMCSWAISEGNGKEFELEIRIPLNTTARIVLPGSGERESVDVGSGAHRFKIPYHPPNWPPAVPSHRFAPNA